MTLFNITHTAGEFIVRTDLDQFAVVEQVGERWGLDVTDIREATQEDIVLAVGQVTELDTEV